MAKSVTAIKDILRREERLLVKLTDTVPLIVHKETKAVMREMAKGKRADIKAYKEILKQAEKCPAIKKPVTAKKK